MARGSVVVIAADAGKGVFAAHFLPATLPVLAKFATSPNGCRKIRGKSSARVREIMMTFKWRRLWAGALHPVIMFGIVAVLESHFGEEEFQNFSDC